MLGIFLAAVIALGSVITPRFVGDTGQYRTRIVENVDMIIIHRNSMGETPEEIRKALLRDPETRRYIGYKFPYHFVVTPEGTVYQTLPLDVVAPHAKGYNTRSFG